MNSPTIFMPKEILSLLSDREWFEKYIIGYYHGVACFYGMKAQIAASAMIESYSQWEADIDRLRKYELNGGTPDHFKQAGHLVYWLRRCKPVYEFYKNESYPAAGSEEDIDFINKGQDLILQFGNQYLAFAIGYHICLLHTIQDPTEAKKFALDHDYKTTICQFLRNKNVSPHALYLIFKSLFYRPKETA